MMMIMLMMLMNDVNDVNDVNVYVCMYMYIIVYKFIKRITYVNDVNDDGYKIL